MHVGALAWIEGNYRRVRPPEPEPMLVSIIELVLIAPEPQTGIASAAFPRQAAPLSGDRARGAASRTPAA
jgi:hypothetical protein